MSGAAGSDDKSGLDRAKRIGTIIEDCLRLQSGGRALADHELIAANPDLMPELGEELRKLELIRAARQEVQRPSPGEPPIEAGLSGHRCLQIRCPHCCDPIEVAQGGGEEIVCPSCGSSFHLDDSPTASWAPHDGEKAIGKFVLIAVIGRGPFGTVYKARDPERDRIVAVKAPRAGSVPGKWDLGRFLREARSAAQLEHPSLVSVREVGLANGVPYVVSDYVSGVTLSDLLSAQRPSFREAAELAAAVAEALDYAHRRGVIHRNVKPSNIILDEQGRPRLMDFGMAEREAGEITMTIDGQVLGTPAYMSPEQARGEAHHADARSDVYSLGVVMYQMLTGELPFRGALRMLVHQVLHDEPRPPRALNDRIPRDLETICLKAMAKEAPRRYQSAGHLAQDVRRFLAGQPIAARPAGRLERFRCWSRRNRLVAALAGTVAVSLLVGTTVPTRFAIRSLRRAEEAGRERVKATAEAGEAEKTRQLALQEAKESQNLAVQQQATAERAVQDQQKAQTEAAKAREAAEREATQRREAQRQAQISNPYRLAVKARESLRENPLCALLLAAEAVETGLKAGSERSPFVEATLRDALGSFRGKVLRIAGQKAAYIAMSPNGRWVLMMGDHGSLRLWDLCALDPTLEPVDLASLGPSFPLVGFSPDGRWLAVEGQVWDLRRACPSVPVTPVRLADCRSLAFSPDSRWMAAINSDGAALLWDLTKQSPFDTTESLSPNAGRAVAMAFSDDGRRLAVGQDDGVVQLWDMTARRARAAPIALAANQPPADSLTFTSDGRWLVAGGWIGKGDTTTCCLWDVAAPSSSSQPHVLRGHRQKIVSAVASPNSQWLVTTGKDNAVRLWDLTASDPSATAIELAGRDTKGALVDPNSRWLILYSRGEVWFRGLAASDASLQQQRPSPAEQPSSGITATAISPDGHWFATGHSGGVLRLYDLTTADPSSAVVTLEAGEARATALKFSGDSRRLAAASGENVLRLWDLAANKPPQTPTALNSQGEPATALAISPDSRWLVAGRWNSFPRSNTCCLWDLAGRTDQAEPLVLDGSQVAHRVSPDSRWLVTKRETPRGSAAGRGAIYLRDWSADAPMELWDLADTRVDQAPARLPQPEAPELRGGLQLGHGADAFSGDGRWLAANSGTTVLLYDLSYRPRVGPPVVLRHESDVYCSIFSADKRWLATATGRTIHLWDLTAKQPGEGSAVLQAHTPSSHSLAFSPDSRRLLAYEPSGGSARLWDLKDSRKVNSPRSLRAAGRGFEEVVFSRDGSWLLSYAKSGRCEPQLWKLNGQGPAAPYGLPAGEIRSASISPDSRWAIAHYESADRIRLWDLKAADPARKPIALRAGDPIDRVGVAPNGHWLVAGDSLWDLTLQDPSASPISLRVGKEGLSRFALSPDGRWLVAGGGLYGGARLWDLGADKPSSAVLVAAGAKIIRLPTDPFLITRDGKWLAASIGDGALRVWELNGQLQQPRATLRTEDAEMAPVAMSPDGRWLVGQSDSGAVRLWDLSVAEPSASSIVLLTGVRGLGPPVSVSFTPNSRRLLLKSGETTGVWTLDPQDLAAIARRAAGRQLTLEELHRYGVAPWTRCYYQAVEHHRKGQYEQAIDDYSRVIEMDADCRLAWANRGKARLDCEKYDEAIADLSKAIELRASYALAWRVRGSAKDALGKREEAAADFDRAAELQPIYDFDAYFRKRAYLVGEEELPAVFETRAPLRTTLLSANYLHHYYEGRREYDRRQCGKASCRFSRSISLNPNHAAAWFGRALARQWTGRWDDAIADLSKALDLKPDYIEARHERAVTLHKAGRREKAIEEYSLLLDANPEYYAAWANRELAMAGKSSRPFRLENKKTIAPDPKDYFTWFERGEANLSRKKWEEAAADYSKVLAIRPDHYLAWGNRGIAHALSGRREQAIEDYTRAIALEANCCLLWHNRGVSLHRLSRYAEAMDDFSKAVKLKPDHASSWRFRGDAKSALGRWKDAIDDYTQSIALKPDEEAVWTRRGEAHRCLRQWRAAEADFRKSLELNRDSVTGWYGLGLVLADKQEFANARSAFQRIGRIRSAAAVQRERAARMADYMSRLSEMAKRFPEILSGATQAANPNEGVLFAELAHFQGAFALSARLSLDAFRRDPRLVVDSGIVHRYNAACSAALAGGGEGDAANTPENVRARWRKQARAWLRDELALKTRRLESRRPQDLEETAAMLQRWQADPDLSAIRDPEPLSQLGADERQECEGLWRDVERLVQRALNTAKASSAATSKG